MKSISTIIIVLVLILVVYYFYSVKQSFKLYYKLDDIKLANLNFQSFVAGNTSIQTRVEFLIFYSGLVGITLSDLNLEVYYNNALVAKTSDVPENKKAIVLSPNVNNIVYHTFDLFLKPQTAELVLTKIKLKQPYILNYTVSGKIYGIPFRKSSSISSDQVNKIN